MTTRRTSTPTYRPRFLDSPVEVAALMAELRALASEIKQVDEGDVLADARVGRLLQWHAELTPLGQLSVASGRPVAVGSADARSEAARGPQPDDEDWTRAAVAR